MSSFTTNNNRNFKSTNTKNRFVQSGYGRGNLNQPNNPSFTPKPGNSTVTLAVDNGLDGKKDNFRINQFLAFHLAVSRRKGDDMVSKGLVEINGNLATLSDRIVKGDKIKYYKNGEWVEIVNSLDNENLNGSGKSNLKTEIIMMYKPIFSLTTKYDPQKRRTIYSILPKQYHHLKPAGRLDYMSEGLIVLTNDGDLMQKLTHPENNSDKEYLVAVRRALPDKLLEKYRAGLEIDDYTTNPVVVSLLKKDELESFEFLNLESHLIWYKFILSEGRNNQIRRMIELDEQNAQRLIRIKHGQFILGPELKERTTLVVKNMPLV